MTLPAVPPKVGLFVTCLVDLFRPSVGFAAIKLLEDAGCTVDVPMAQTCCGQPAYNSGDRADSRAHRRATRSPPSRTTTMSWRRPGSCAGMLKKHYPGLFGSDPAWRRARRGVSAKVHELVGFLVDVRGCDRRSTRASTAPSPTTIPARACASSASRRSRARCSPRSTGVEARRDAGRGRLLRLRRHVLRQISRHLQRHRREEDRRHRRGRRRHAARRRPRLPDEHGRQAEAAGLAGRGPPRRRGAGRHDRHAADRRRG